MATAQTLLRRVRNSKAGDERSHPTPQTNPLLWWLAVLVQIEVLDDQPRWLLAALRDTLDFMQKLEAIDHYARVTVLETSFFEWIHRGGSHAATEKEKDSVIALLDTG
ncbi:hypothetical protein BDW62DRAFT_205040 [Aspergillus aurantiobrunneus]